MAISKQTRKLVYAKYKGRCAYCGKEITVNQMQIDHLIPLRRNTTQEEIDRFNRNNVEHIEKGTNELSNLMPACSSCNAAKGEMTVNKFRQTIQQCAKSIMKGVESKLSVAYGLVEYHPHPVKFYFETKHI